VIRRISGEDSSERKEQLLGILWLSGF